MCEGAGAREGGSGGSAAVAVGARPDAAAHGPLAPLSPAARSGTAQGMRNRQVGIGVGA